MCSQLDSIELLASAGSHRQAGLTSVRAMTTSAVFSFRWLIMAPVPLPSVIHSICAHAHIRHATQSSRYFSRGTRTEEKAKVGNKPGVRVWEALALCGSGCRRVHVWW